MTAATTDGTGRLEGAVEVVILLAVAGMAGAASFTHVHDWTMHNSPTGTGDWFGWANAMVSELIPLAAGLEARRRHRTYGNAGRYPIALIIGAVALSLTGQFAEAKHSISGWLISAVPALGFLALVKLILSRPTQVSADPDMPSVALIDQADMHTPAEQQQPSPATTATAATVPVHLLSTARFAVTNHEVTTGAPITAEQLAGRMSIPVEVATQLLTHLHHNDTAATADPPPMRVNGAPVLEAAR